MDITPLISSDQQVIQAYAGGRFKISNVMYEHPVLVYPNRAIPWDADLAPPDFQGNHFDALLSQLEDVDICLLGAGASGFFVPSPIRDKFRERRIGLDVMDTGAACRTYNVLLAEGRRVVAALYPL